MDVCPVANASEFYGVEVGKAHGFYMIAGLAVLG